MRVGRNEWKSLWRIHTIHEPIHLHSLHRIDDAIAARMVMQQRVNTEHVVGKDHYSWVVLQDLFNPVHSFDISILRHNRFLEGEPAYLADAPNSDKHTLSNSKA